MPRNKKYSDLLWTKYAISKSVEKIKNSDFCNLDELVDKVDLLIIQK